MIWRNVTRNEEVNLPHILTVKEEARTHFIRVMLDIEKDENRLPVREWVFEDEYDFIEV
jgi:hypothetical protein